MTFQGRIYATDGEILSFSSEAVAVRENPDGTFLVRLKETAFFPGGGGQEADLGTLSFGGQTVPVLETLEDEEGVWHRLTVSPGTGETVRGDVEESRFFRMQSHTGEHILSGTFHRLYGLSNVGFHLGRDVMTIDLSGELTPEMLEEAETQANRAVWADLPVQILFPDEAELAGMDFRSKKELSGEIRLIRIPGVDLCACCAPHLSSTGKVGMIKIVSAVRYKGGMRLTVRCGREALLSYRRSLKTEKALCALFSSPEDRLAEAAAEAMEEKAEIGRRLKENLLCRARELGRSPERTGETALAFLPDADADVMRAFANEASLSAPLSLALSGREGNYRYVMISQRADVGEIAKKANAELDGKGGGRGTMVMGTFRCSEERIRSYFSSLSLPSS